MSYIIQVYVPIILCAVICTVSNSDKYHQSCTSKYICIFLSVHSISSHHCA